MKEMNSFGDNNLVHYEGILGVFDYDPEEFEVRKIWYHEYLHYHGNGKSVDLPEGCTDTSYMFSECKLPEGFSLGEHFDTSNVTYMEHMFSCCKLPKGFSLGDHFDTSNVTDMCTMFYNCVMPKGFNLGEQFSTDGVVSMQHIFDGCTYYGVDVHEFFQTQNDEEIISRLKN